LQEETGMANKRHAELAIRYQLRPVCRSGAWGYR